MKERLHYEDNRQGWLLELRQYWHPERLDPTRRPVLMIPGSCMNSFILNFHPTGDSMVKYLVDRGVEVWTANLRGQGGTRRIGGSRKFGFREVSLVDVPSAIHFVQNHTRTERRKIDAVGCSLGATYLYAYLAHHIDDHALGGLVAVGGPLRWEESHPLLKFAFQSPALAGMLPVFGTRELAKRFLPIAKRLPFVLDIYMNTNRIDLSQADQLVRTVDDPIPYLNKQIAHWVGTQDLHVAGLNVTQQMACIDTPTLCIVANADGIVPASTAVSVRDAIGTDDVEILNVGNSEDWFAHADLFISDLAQDQVFEPLHDWLTRKA